MIFKKSKKVKLLLKNIKTLFHIQYLIINFAPEDFLMYFYNEKTGFWPQIYHQFSQILNIYPRKKLRCAPQTQPKNLKFSGIGLNILMKP